MKLETKKIKTEDMVPWLAYATYGEDGFMNGIRDDSPLEIKRLYEKHRNERRASIVKGDIIPK